jgi:Ser/Thr protein kinase RdoA (MazF antagonist)
MLLSSIEKYWSLHNAGIVADLEGFDDKIVLQIKADEGEFVVKIREPFYSELEIEQELFIFDFLQSRNFRHAPVLLRCRDGFSFRRLSEGFVYVYRFIEGEKPAPSIDSYRKLGELMAKLHQLEGYPHLAKWSMSDVIGHIIAHRAPQLPSEIKNEYLKIAEGLCVMDNLPLCLVHGDISLSNSIQRSSGDIVLVDWDGCAINTRIFDAAHLLLQFLSKNLVFDDKAAKAFYRAYFSAQKLTDKEFGCFFDAALISPLNFILFGCINENWAKIKWACQRREWLMEKIDELRN